MIIHWNNNNRELKKYLREHGITYKMLADTAGYCEGTIAQWMRYPLSTYRKEVIQTAIKRAKKKYNLVEQKAMPVIPPGTLNYELKCQLSEMEISYSDIAKCLGVSSRTVWGWFNRTKPISQKRRAVIDGAVQKIREERRLYYESD